MEYGIRKLTVTLDPKAIKILEEKEKKNKIKEDAVMEQQQLMVRIQKHLR